MTEALERCCRLEKILSDPCDESRRETHVDLEDCNVEVEGSIIVARMECVAGDEEQMAAAHTARRASPEVDELRWSAELDAMC